jgi:hypothetical protein
MGRVGSWSVALAGLVGGAAAVHYGLTLMQSNGATALCIPVKGNISSTGERIYHVPGQKVYEETKISSRRGERWFCSEEEARTAGWRKSRT